MRTSLRSGGSRCGPDRIERTICRLGFAAIILAFAFLSIAAEPASRPAAVSEQQLAGWVASLNDLSPAARASATAALLDLQRDDLAQLKAVVRKASPLSPAQVEVLHDVVMHVYLSGEQYPKLTSGFLGMRMIQLDQLDRDPRTIGQGIIIQSRMAGFGAYRSLLDGDVLLSIEEYPNNWLTDSGTFVMLIKQTRPGTTLHMMILRQGRQMTVPVTIDARPADARMNNNDPDSAEEYNNSRLLLAEEYWEKQFGLVAGESYSRAD